MQENLPQPTCRQDRFLRENRDGFAGRGIEHVRPEARQGLIPIFQIIRVVGQGQQIDCDPPCATRDLRRLINASRHGREDRVPRCILRMNDPPRAVTALAGEIQFSRCVAIKRYLQFLQQHLLHRPRALAHQVLHRGRIRRAITRLEDVSRQRFRILRHIVDDATLRPVAVRRQGLGQRQQFHREAELCRMQRVR
jgi:hypothetical protein